MVVHTCNLSNREEEKGGLWQMASSRPERILRKNKVVNLEEQVRLTSSLYIVYIVTCTHTKSRMNGAPGGL